MLELLEKSEWLGKWPWCTVGVYESENDPQWQKNWNSKYLMVCRLLSVLCIQTFYKFLVFSDSLIVNGAFVKVVLSIF